MIRMLKSGNAVQTACRFFTTHVNLLAACALYDSVFWAAPSMALSFRYSTHRDSRLRLQAAADTRLP